MSFLASIPFPFIDPVAFRLGPVAVRWYGLAYLTGFALAYLLLRRLIRRGILLISEDALAFLMGWLTLGVIVGGRLGWWLIYHRNDAAAERWYEPIAIWHGGMSFHGGLIGGASATISSRFWQYHGHSRDVYPNRCDWGRSKSFHKLPEKRRRSSQSVPIEESTFLRGTYARRRKPAEHEQ